MTSKRFKKLPVKTISLPPAVIEKLIPEIKKNCTTKFNESIDLNLQINNKQKKGEVNLRTVANLPAGTGKKVKVAVTLGTTQEQQAKQIFPKATLNIIESPARDFQEVLAGRSDVHITTNIEASSLVAKYPEMAIIPVSEPKYPTPLAWLTPQDDQVLINYLNHWIEIKKSQGFFDLMMNKYNLKSL